MSKTYLLSEVAGIFRHILRANDVGGRITPERLGLLLPETDEIRAQLVADKIRAAVSKHEFLGTLADGRVRVAVSIGIAVADDEFAAASDLMAAAESALADAIAAGGHYVRLYERPKGDDAEGGNEPYRLAS
jgi:diguanylate cyclase (GGDEF)-like protein